MTKSTPSPDESSTPVVRKQRWLRPRSLFLLAAGGVVGMIALAPQLISFTGLHHTLAQRLTAGTKWTVHPGQVELSWFDATRVTNLTVEDKDGNTLLIIPRLSTPRSLTHLLTSRDFGDVEIEKPEINIRCWEGGSSLEEFFQDFAGESDAAPAVYGLKIHDAVVRVDQRDSGKRTVFKHLYLNSDNRGEQPVLDLQTRLDCESTSGELLDHTGMIRITQKLDPSESNQSARRIFQVVAEDLELQRLDACVQRFFGDAHLTGRISTDFALDRPEDRGWESGLLRGDARANDVTIQIPSRLGNDRLEFASVLANGRVDWDGDVLRLGNTKIESDVLRLTARGETGLPALRKVLDRARSAAQANAVSFSSRSNEFAADDTPELSGLRIMAELNLARLAPMLRETLQLHDGIELKSGVLKLDVHQADGAEGQPLIAKLTTSPFRAVRDGQTVTWEQPLHAEVRASRAPDTNLLRLNSIQCKSSFFDLTMKPNESGYAMRGECRLSELSRELKRFANLERPFPDGSVQLSADLETQPSGNFFLQSDLTSDGLKFQPLDSKSSVLQTSRAKSEPFRARVVAQGKSDGLFPSELRLLEITANSGTDELHSELKRPCSFPLTNDQACELKVAVRGDLRAWTNRLMTSSLPVTLSGKGDLGAVVRVTPAELIVDQGRGSVERMILRHEQSVIIDPLVDAAFAASIERATGNLTLRYGKLDGRYSSLDARDVRVTQSGRNEFQAAGDIVLNSRLRHSYRHASAPKAQPVHGEVSAELHLQPAHRVTQLTLDGTVKNLLLFDDAQRRIFSEDSVKFGGAVEYQSPRLVIHHAAADGAEIGFRAGGELILDDVMTARLSGEVRYDMQRLTALVRAFAPDSLPEDFAAEGRGIRPFYVRGPVSMATDSAGAAIVPRRLDAGFGIHWDRARSRGLKIGQAELDVRLREALLSFRPLDVELNSARLQCSPVVDLQANPPVLDFRNASMTSLNLSDPYTQEMVAWIAPALSDATDLQGRVSLNVDHARLPINDLAAGRMEGVCRIHHATAQPGPLASELISVVNDVRGLLDKTPRTGGQFVQLTMPDQRVIFKMHNHRVQHQQARFVVNSTSVSTRGTVVTNSQRVALVASLPVQEKWLGNNKYLRSLNGQNIDIPIHGTLTRPAIDRGFIGNIARGAATNALDSVVRDKMERGLRDIFGRVLDK